MKSEIEEFGDFAELSLNNHAMELHTKYENREPSSDETIREAYAIHRKILSKELDQKIELLIGENDPWLKQQAMEIKKKYIGNLIYVK